jgi:hypothetical protein
LQPAFGNKLLELLDPFRGRQPDGVLALELLLEEPHPRVQGGVPRAQIVNESLKRRKRTGGLALFHALIVGREGPEKQVK